MTTTAPLESIVFTVPGDPQPQGSARAFLRPGGRFPVVTSDNPKLKGWRKTVAQHAQRVFRDAPIEGPIRVVAAFYLRRPKKLRGDRPHTTRPDVDKMARALGDALSGVVYHDDGQITQFKVTKAYAGVDESPRSVIAITALDPAPLFSKGRSV